MILLQWNLSVKDNLGPAIIVLNREVSCIVSLIRGVLYQRFHCIQYIVEKESIKYQFLSYNLDLIIDLGIDDKKDEAKREH